MNKDIHKPTSISSFLIVLLFLFLITGGGCATYVYLNAQHDVEKAELENRIDELESDISELKGDLVLTGVEPGAQTDLSAVKEETADWKTYENKEYGFSFRYPKDWHVQDNMQKTGIAGVGDRLIFYKDDLNGLKFYVYVNPAFGGNYPEISYKSVFANGKLSVSDRKVNGKLDDGMLTDPQIGAVSFGIVKISGNDFLFSADKITNSSDEDLVKQILLSFNLK